MLISDPDSAGGAAPCHVHELGRADGPILLLLHGFTDSGLCWPDAARRWRHEYRIVAPDARGHGESPRYDATTGGSNRSGPMVADVIFLLEGLARDGGERPVLIGHSMGAGIAGIVMAARPDLVRAAVLEDPPWFTAPPGDDSAPYMDTTQQQAQVFRDDLDLAIAGGRVELPLWPEIEFRPWAVSKTQIDPSLTDREQIIRHAPWLDDAAAIARPTLVITGGRDQEVLVSSRSRQRLAELGNHHIEVAVIPGAGHTVRRDCTEAYHQIADPWIRERFRDAASS